MALLYCRQGLFKPTQNGAPAVELKLSYEASVGGVPMAYTFLSPQALNVVDKNNAISIWLSALELETPFAWKVTTLSMPFTGKPLGPGTWLISSYL